MDVNAEPFVLDSQEKPPTPTSGKVRNNHLTRRRGKGGKKKAQQEAQLPHTNVLPAPPQHFASFAFQQQQFAQEKLRCLSPKLFPQHRHPSSSDTLHASSSSSAHSNNANKSRIDHDIWEDEQFKTYVDNADPQAMELLVRDLALALPGISERMVEKRQSDLHTFASDSPDLRYRTNSLDCLSISVARAVVGGDEEDYVGYFSTQHLESTPPPDPPVWKEYDPDRELRVAWVVEMAEMERFRRQEEVEKTAYQGLQRVATRIEWAVLASQAIEKREMEAAKLKRERENSLKQVKMDEESERTRRIGQIAEDYVAPADSSSIDYEVICPYNTLGCEHTLKRSELAQHFQVCVFRAEVREANRLAYFNETYNPLDHIVVCPYTVMGCTHTCRRMDLPAHLQVCPQRVEVAYHQTPSFPYEIVCPYAKIGCGHTCAQNELAVHLATCAFRPLSRDEEAAERDLNKAKAIEAEEAERIRRVKHPRERIHSADLLNNSVMLNAINHHHATLKPVRKSKKERNLKVSWVRKAAEIEILRQREERLAMERATLMEREGSAPPGRRQIVLENALRRQKLHNAKWFPSESLAFQGRRTHVHTFHNHLEQQTRLLHRTLHEEIERFGRDCALWEIEATDTVTELIDKIRIVVESCWQKYVSVTTRPTISIFGSFASELSVPGVSDLDLVVVPGEEVPAPPGSPTRRLIKDRLEAARRCLLIGEALSLCPDFLQNVRVIDTASVPVVTMSTNAFEFEQGMDIDLTVALSQHDGVQAAEFVKLLRVRFPPLMPMVRLLKAFLFVRGLANPFRGGLSSYALVLMAAVSVMRSFDRAGKAIFLNLGELIVDFLEFYGREFDCTRDAVICSRDPVDLEQMGIRRGGMRGGKGRYLRIGHRWESSSSDIEHVMLVVDDPIRIGNNIGRPCFAFERVQAAFAEALVNLLSHVVKLGRGGGGGEVGVTMVEKIFGVRPMSASSHQ